MTVEVKKIFFNRKGAKKMNIYKINYTHENKFKTYTEDAKNQIEAVQHLFIDLLRLSNIKPQDIIILSVSKIK